MDIATIIAICVGAALLIAGGLSALFKYNDRRVRQRIREKFNDRDETTPRWLLRLAGMGIDTRLIGDDEPYHLQEAGYAVCAGKRLHGTSCDDCGSTHVRRIAETLRFRRDVANPLIWFATACDDCGRVKRQPNAANVGFLSTWLGKNGNLYDAVAALEPYVGRKGYLLMAAALEDRSRDYADLSRAMREKADAMTKVVEESGDPTSKGARVLSIEAARGKKRRPRHRPNKKKW